VKEKDDCHVVYYQADEAGAIDGRHPITVVRHAWPPVMVEGVSLEGEYFFQTVVEDASQSHLYLADGKNPAREIARSPLLDPVSELKALQVRPFRAHVMVRDEEMLLWDQSDGPGTPLCLPAFANTNYLSVWAPTYIAGVAGRKLYLISGVDHSVLAQWEVAEDLADLHLQACGWWWWSQAWMVGREGGNWRVWLQRMEGPQELDLTGECQVATTARQIAFALPEEEVARWKLDGTTFKREEES